MNASKSKHTKIWNGKGSAETHSMEEKVVGG